MTTIMIVEDEASLREEIVEMLGFEGYDVIQAEHGVAALRLLERQIPDLIISDISMPDMDGYTLLERVRTTPTISLIPFILLTAHAERSFVRHGMELGADDYIPKPFTSAELLAAVKSRIGRVYLQSEAIQKQLDVLKSQLARCPEIAIGSPHHPRTTDPAGIHPYGFGHHRTANIPFG